MAGLIFLAAIYIFILKDIYNMCLNMCARRSLQMINQFPICTFTLATFEKLIYFSIVPSWNIFAKYDTFYKFTITSASNWITRDNLSHKCLPIFISGQYSTITFIHTFWTKDECILRWWRVFDNAFIEITTIF